MAELIGLNLFRGRAEGNRLELAGGQSLILGGRHSGEVLAVVHSRAVALYRSPPDGSPRNAWQGVLEHMEVEGDRARARVGGKIPVTAEVTPQAAGELRRI